MCLWPPLGLPSARPPASHRAHGALYLGAGHADLWARVDVDAAVGLSGDGAAHGVGDAHSQGPAVLAVTQCQQGVCGLACHRVPCFQLCVYRHVALPAQAPAPTHSLPTLTQK